MTRRALLAAVLVALATLGGACGGSQQRPREHTAVEIDLEREGWATDFSRRAVPLSAFQAGGPGKDGIPSIDRPRFVPAGQAGFLSPEEPVIELVVGGQARGYPIQILIWHEIVNDEVGGIPVAVTFCPLCNTALVFDRRVDGATLDFGVSGRLRDSDLVMYDRETESWWQQFGGEGVVGHYTGERLEQLPARIVSWKQFAAAHSDGLVLDRPKAHPTSRASDFLRPYGRNPYTGYDDVDSSPLFPTRSGDDERLHPKERVVFVERGGETVAIPFSALDRRKPITVEVGGDKIVVHHRPGVRSPFADSDVGAVDVRLDGRLIPFDQPFWFAVAAFRPRTRIVR